MSERVSEVGRLVRLGFAEPRSGTSSEGPGLLVPSSGTSPPGPGLPVPRAGGASSPSEGPGLLVPETSLSMLRTLAGPGPLGTGSGRMCTCPA